MSIYVGKFGKTYEHDLDLDQNSNPIAIKLGSRTGLEVF